MSDLHHTATHEAGHAVIGRVLKLPCEGATIIPNEEELTAGFALTSNPDKTWDWQEQTRRLVRKHRDEIERVAAALLACRTLSGDEIDKLFAG